MGYAEEASASVTNRIVVFIRVGLDGNILGFVVVTVIAISALQALACMGGFFRNIPCTIRMSGGFCGICLTDFLTDGAAVLRIAIYCAGSANYFCFKFISGAVEVDRFAI